MSGRYLAREGATTAEDCREKFEELQDEFERLTGEARVLEHSVAEGTARVLDLA